MTGVSRQLPGVSNVIGLIEITTALLIASRPLLPQGLVLGQLKGNHYGPSDINFLFSTPGALQLGHGISILGDTGQFLIKDLVLLGASCWIAAEALRAAGEKINRPV
jgi:reactive chlorine resistance protein C